MDLILFRFVGTNQLMAIKDGLRGEEKDFFKEQTRNLVKTINTMPKVYEQDGKGDQAIAYLHYFKGGMDWYILEKDCVENEPQYQAFGYANLGFGFDSELGYISIEELIRNNIEIDLHWIPTKLIDIKNKRGE